MGWSRLRRDLILTFRWLPCGLLIGPATQGNRSASIQIEVGQSPAKSGRSSEISHLESRHDLSAELSGQCGRRKLLQLVEARVHQAEQA